MAAMLGSSRRGLLRLISRSRPLYADNYNLVHGNTTSYPYSTKGTAAPAAPRLKGDELLKGIFTEVTKKYEAALGVLKKEKIIIDPEDPAAVQQYAKVMKTVREKADFLSDSQRIKYTIEQETEGIPDARTYLLTLQQIRIKYGLVDEIGAESMMMDALEKVEKEIKKPLLRSDKANMKLLLAEFEKGNKKLGIDSKDLPKLEEDLELKIAKAELTELKKEISDAMETQIKREEFKDEAAVDVKALDVRNFL